MQCGLFFFFELAFTRHHYFEIDPDCPVDNSLLRVPELCLWCGCPTLCLSLHLVMDIWVASRCWLFRGRCYEQPLRSLCTDVSVHFSGLSARSGPAGSCGGWGVLYVPQCLGTCHTVSQRGQGSDSNFPNFVLFVPHPLIFQIQDKAEPGGWDFREKGG